MPTISAILHDIAGISFIVICLAFFIVRSCAQLNIQNFYTNHSPRSRTSILAELIDKYSGIWWRLGLFLFITLYSFLLLWKDRSSWVICAFMIVVPLIIIIPTFLNLPFNKIFHADGVEPIVSFDKANAFLRCLAILHLFTALISIIVISSNILITAVSANTFGGAFFITIVGHTLSSGSRLLPSVSFSGPGYLISAGFLSRDLPGFVVDSSLDAIKISVLPDYDLVPRIDLQAGLQQFIACASNNPIECHNIQRTCCELLRSCGDPFGRIIATRNQMTCAANNRNISFEAL